MATRIASHSRTSQQRHIFMTAFPGEDLAWVLSAGLLISDFIHSADVGELTSAGTGHVIRGDLLLVTHAVGASMEQLLKVRLGQGQVSLTDIWPVASYSKYQPINKGKPSIFIANVGWVTDGIQKRKIGAVVIDAMHPRTLMHAPAILSKLAHIPIVMVVAPPLGERDLKSFGYPQTAHAWLWDPAAKRTVAECITGKNTDHPSPVNRTIWVCDDNEVDEVLGEIHDLLGVCQREAKTEFPPLWFAWSIYHRLRQLAVSLSQFEDSSLHAWGAFPLHKRLERLKKSWPSEVAIQARWRGILNGLQGTYDLLQNRQEPKKFWGVAERVQAHLENDPERFRVVVPSDREVALLTLQLGQIVDGWFDALHAETVEVVSARGEARSLARGEERKTLLAGFRSGSLRHLDLYPRHETEVLAYPYEVAVDEAARNYIYRFAESLQHDTYRCDLLDSIGFSRCEGGECKISPRPYVTIEGENDYLVRKVRKPLMDPTYLDFQKLSDSGMPQGWDEDNLQDPGMRSEQRPDEGERLEVAFEYGASVTYSLWQVVDVYHPGTETIQRQDVTDLRPGMKVVGMVDGVYERLYDRVLEALDAKESPYYTMALELWDQAKMAALKKHSGSKTDLYDSLAAKGLGVGYQAVVQWYRGGDLDNLAPQQYDDMKLVAEMSGTYPTDELIKTTWRVIQRERVRRRKAGKALHALLRAIIQGDGYDAAVRSARELGNEVGEVFGAVEVRTVVAVNKVSSGGT